MTSLEAGLGVMLKRSKVTKEQSQTEGGNHSHVGGTLRKERDERKKSDNRADIPLAATHASAHRPLFSAIAAFSSSSNLI
jgi:hypothetical protein